MDTNALYLLLAIAGFTVTALLVFYILFRNSFERALQATRLDLTTTLSQRISEVDQASGQSFENIKENLGRLSRATDQMLEVGKTITSLEDLLKPPKIRGGMGETLLEELLAQILPNNYFAFQHPFRSGEKVDAAIFLGDRIVPVDAKFPLEQFRQMLTSQKEQEQRTARRNFLRDVKKHIDDIAVKYIKADEGTYDFALMYITAENVYYETIIKEENEEGLYTYSLQKKVIPVSPNSFYAYLQVIIYGLKGMQIEQKTRDIIDHLTRLMTDEQKLRDEFNVLGSHLKNAHNKYADTERVLSLFEDKLQETDKLTTAKQLEE